jgi:hypothetical protein
MIKEGVFKVLSLQIVVGNRSIILTSFCIVKYVSTFLPKSLDNYRKIFYPPTL